MCRRPQFEVIRLVGELTGVPVPGALDQTTPATCFEQVLSRCGLRPGVVPPDVMPYTLTTGSPTRRRRQRQLQDATVAALATTTSFVCAERRLLTQGRTSDPLHRHFNWVRSWRDFAVEGIGRSPTGTDFQWLPPLAGLTLPLARPVLLWRDARVGNVLVPRLSAGGGAGLGNGGAGSTKTRRRVDDICAAGVFQELAGLATLPGLRR